MTAAEPPAAAAAAAVAHAPRPRHAPEIDARRHRRIDGLHDVWLIPHPSGGVTTPDDPRTTMTAGLLAEMVRRSGTAAEDVRILVSDGGSRLDMFRDMASLLGHDVLVCPAGAVLRQQAANGDPTGPLDAVPVDETTGRVVDWELVQPLGRATDLPGWFALHDGLVRPRTGVVALPLPGGLALATRADFVTRRAVAARLLTRIPGLATVAVTVRAGGFLVGDYRGTQDVVGGDLLAAALGGLPLYGGDVRMWLTWPTEPEAQQRLVANLAALARTAGARVWAPPPGGSVELVDGADLRALDRLGRPAPWQSHEIPGCMWSTRFRPDDDGTLHPADGTVVRHATAPVRTERPGPPVQPAPHMVPDTVKGAPFGVPWLPDQPFVNAETVELYVATARPPVAVALAGVPSPDLFLFGRLRPRPFEAGREPGYLLRVKVGKGAAVQISGMGSHVPAHLQHLMRASDAYLLPIGRLDRVRLLAGYRLEADGTIDGDPDLFKEAPLLLQSAQAHHGAPGLPTDVERWPSGRDRTMFVRLPANARRLPPGWLVLHRRKPDPLPGHVLVEVSVPKRRAIDIVASERQLAGFRALRSRIGKLRAAGLELILPSRSYERVTMKRLYKATPGGWESVARGHSRPLTSGLPNL
ncbi:hypothetical protein Val02_64460 [Virgisporangium aliadipatigenens]|uniref:Uncharacterized protein n=1 Tax=Virgisporangium aliadipatigenens TaxID=741659 RepID=A0A8J3YTC3_9ACTN|nr:hypothetical protein [Virgisporangium aliadipatigenens]GIJ49560.1 hypothetical protein Val02_64460 [Virgisporangium aliadipatigenens]